MKAKHWQIAWALCLTLLTLSATGQTRLGQPLNRSGSAMAAPAVPAQPMSPDQVRNYQLAAGDLIHIVVYQTPDMTVDTRVSENGTITYPLIGEVKVGGLTVAQAELKIAKMLETGGFVRNPQVNITLTQIVGNQVSVLGFVNRPGSYPLLTFDTKLTQMLADAGGIAPLGSQIVILSGTRNGKHFDAKIDVSKIYTEGQVQNDVTLYGGDSIFVPKAAMFYIYGEVNHPGEYPLEPNMTVMQALAAGGGPTVRGSGDSLRLTRKGPDGQVHKYSPELSDQVQPNDVLYVNESLF